VNLVEQAAGRPIVVAIAGPNGAGKSTYYDAYLADIGLPFVNADLLALSMGTDAYTAAAIAGRIRQALLAQRQSFIFETVFSDPAGEKLELLKEAHRLGYFVLLVFIGVSSAGVSDRRVAMRAASGGHDVPQQKLAERFPRILQNLRRALRELPNVRVYDHSDLAQGYRLVAIIEAAQPIEVIGPVPEWLRPLLPRDDRRARIYT
jgi:predicted ABC-type ATPase